VRRDGLVMTEPTAQERVWSAIKALGAFGQRDVEAATGCTHATVRRFVTALARAGYLAPIGPGRWRLLRSRDTGPRPPIVRRDGTVVDGNTGEIVATAQDHAST